MLSADSSLTTYTKSLTLCYESEQLWWNFQAQTKMNFPSWTTFIFSKSEQFTDKTLMYMHVMYSSEWLCNAFVMEVLVCMKRKWVSKCIRNTEGGRSNLWGREKTLRTLQPDLPVEFFMCTLGLFVSRSSGLITAREWKVGYVTNVCAVIMNGKELCTLCCLQLNIVSDIFYN